MEVENPWKQTQPYRWGAYFSQVIFAAPSEAAGGWPRVSQGRQEGSVACGTTWAGGTGKHEDPLSVDPADDHNSCKENPYKGKHIFWKLSKQPLLGLLERLTALLMWRQAEEVAASTGKSRAYKSHKTTFSARHELSPCSFQKGTPEHPLYK